MFGLFGAATIAWGLTLHKCGSSVQRIHWLMLVLVVFKALTCLCQVGRLRIGPARLCVCMPARSAEGFMLSAGLRRHPPPDSGR